MSKVPLPHRRSIPLIVLIAAYLIFTVTLVAVTHEPDSQRPLEQGKSCLR